MNRDALVELFRTILDRCGDETTPEALRLDAIRDAVETYAHDAYLDLSEPEPSYPAKPFDKYAWPGGYPLYVLMADGDTLCIDCANTEEQARFDNTENTGWRIQALDVNWEDPQMICCHCHTRIESAYAENDTAQ